MIRFFIPISKVQKDRRIIRQTDLRMAKYSRRGLLFNIIAYLICLMGGRFNNENQDLTILLTIGLILVTVLRGMLLFRFENLYPRAPARWRTSYFIATLMGAFWWCVILICVTIKLEMQDEAPLLWLYTVIFFSSTAHAFAPYKKFLSHYQFVGLVPAACAAFFLDDFYAYVYGSLLIAFYLVLNHQCRLISENYWERLEATYALSKKSETVEEEKRDNQASAELNREFLKYLHIDLQCLLKDINALKSPAQSEPLVGGPLQPQQFVPQNNEQLPELFDKKVNFAAGLHKIYSDVEDFSRILSKELVLDTSIFNIRHELQHIIADFVDKAESQQVILEASLSPALPMRLKGDASRFAQVVRTLLSLSLQNIQRGLVLVEVEFLREYETAGELQITVSRYNLQTRKLFSTAEDEGHCFATANLSLAVAKGIAEQMQGGIELNDTPREGQKIRFNGKFDIAEFLGPQDFHRNSYSGHSVLLVHESPMVVDIKRQELEALGFHVFTETQYKRALQLLMNNFKQGTRIESVLYYLDDSDAVKEFNLKLCEHPDLKFTHQVLAVTEKQKQQYTELGFCFSEQVYFIDKPIGLFELELTYRQILHKKSEVLPATDSDEEPVQEAPTGEPLRLLLLSYVDNTIEFITKKLDAIHCEILILQTSAQASSLIKEQQHLPDVFLIDCDNSRDLVASVGEIRAFEKSLGSENYLPILGLSSTYAAKEIAAYELGIDDFIELGKKESDLGTAIEFWASLAVND